MSEKFSRKPFEVLTLAGHRHSVTYEEILSWLSTRLWWISVLVLQIVLITLMPHNQFYDLSFSQRLVFWPLTTLVYVLIYLACTYFGAIYATGSPDRTYYTPVGILLASLIVTYLSTYYLGYIHGTPQNFGAIKWMEIIFNALWAAMFEAFHYAFNVPRIRKNQREKKKHDWEKFD